MKLVNAKLFQIPDTLPQNASTKNKHITTSSVKLTKNLSYTKNLI